MRNFEEEHPSYGLISLSRVSGTKTLFGSDVEPMAFIRLEIKNGVRGTNNLGLEYYRALRNHPIVSVDLSHAQFAELITTMNSGDGVPCTIARLGHTPVESPPMAKSEGRRLREAFLEDVKGTIAALKSSRGVIREMLGKKTLNRSDKAAIDRAITDVIRVFDDRAPFILGLFQEAMEKMAQKTKTEVEAFAQHALTRAGIHSVSAPKLPSHVDEG